MDAWREEKHNPAEKDSCVNTKLNEYKYDGLHNVVDKSVSISPTAAATAVESGSSLKKMMCGSRHHLKNPII